MAHYKVTVFERIVQEYEYEVEADSAEEAKRNALDGLYEIREPVAPISSRCAKSTVSRS